MIRKKSKKFNRLKKSNRLKKFKKSKRLKISKKLKKSKKLFGGSVSNAKVEQTDRLDKALLCNTVFMNKHLESGQVTLDTLTRIYFNNECDADILGQSSTQTSNNQSIIHLPPILKIKDFSKSEIDRFIFSVYNMDNNPKEIYIQLFEKLNVSDILSTESTKKSVRSNDIKLILIAVIQNLLINITTLIYKCFFEKDNPDHTKAKAKEIRELENAEAKETREVENVEERELENAEAKETREVENVEAREVENVVAREVEKAWNNLIQKRNIKLNYISEILTKFKGSEKIEINANEAKEEKEKREAKEKKEADDLEKIKNFFSTESLNISKLNLNLSILLEIYKLSILHKQSKDTFNTSDRWFVRKRIFNIINDNQNQTGAGMKGGGWANKILGIIGLTAASAGIVAVAAATVSGGCGALLIIGGIFIIANSLQIRYNNNKLIMITGGLLQNKVRETIVRQATNDIYQATNFCKTKLEPIFGVEVGLCEEHDGRIHGYPHKVNVADNVAKNLIKLQSMDWKVEPVKIIIPNNYLEEPKSKFTRENIINIYINRFDIFFKVYMNNWHKHHTLKQSKSNLTRNDYYSELQNNHKSLEKQDSSFWLNKITLNLYDINSNNYYIITRRKKSNTGIKFDNETPELIIIVNIRNIKKDLIKIRTFIVKKKFEKTLKLPYIRPFNAPKHLFPKYNFKEFEDLLDNKTPFETEPIINTNYDYNNIFEILESIKQELGDTDGRNYFKVNEDIYFESDFTFNVGLNYTNGDLEYDKLFMLNNQQNKYNLIEWIQNNEKNKVEVFCDIFYNENSEKKKKTIKLNIKKYIDRSNNSKMDNYIQYNIFLDKTFINNIYKISIYTKKELLSLFQINHMEREDIFKIINARCKFFTNLGRESICSLDHLPYCVWEDSQCKHISEKKDLL